GESCWVALAANETRWSAKTVLSHYLVRWGIEVFFKMSKQYLGLGDYQLLRYRGIERYLCLVLIAYILLPHLAVEQLDAKARGEKTDLRLPSIPQLQNLLRSKMWEHAIDSLGRGQRYKAIARKIKEHLDLCA
ncbi:MAG TPA: hypothetical protein EYH34_18565, partial [Planctomycetes bacterium]|nr:hypothetical protein [Planctomycetota bacterium]